MTVLDPSRQALTYFPTKNRKAPAMASSGLDGVRYWLDFRSWLIGIGMAPELWIVIQQDKPIISKELTLFPEQRLRPKVKLW